MYPQDKQHILSKNTSKDSLKWRQIYNFLIARRIGQPFTSEKYCLEIVLSSTINIIMTKNLYITQLLAISTEYQNKAGHSPHGLCWNILQIEYNLRKCIVKTIGKTQHFWKTY